MGVTHHTKSMCLLVKYCMYSTPNISNFIQTIKTLDFANGERHKRLFRFQLL